MTTIRGIGDALMAGNLTLAGQIAVAGLRLVFVQGLQAIADLFGRGSTFGTAISNIGGKLLRGDLQGAWKSVVTLMAAGWDAFVVKLVSSFKGAVDSIRTVWNTMVSGIQASISGIAAALRARGMTTAALALEVANVGVTGIAAPVGQGLDFTSDMAGAVEKAMQQKADESNKEKEKDAQEGADKTGEEVARLTAELAALRQQAAVVFAAANAPKPPGLAAGLPDIEATKRATFGSFSAAGLAGNATTGGDKVAKTLIEMKRHRREQHEKDAAQRRELLKVTKDALAMRMRP